MVENILETTIVDRQGRPTTVPALSDTPGVPPIPETVTETVTSSVSRDGQTPWFSRHLRNMIAMILTIAVCYLALVQGDTTAAAALVASFSILVGAIWGERSALKRPGQDT